MKSFGLKETGILTSVSDYHIFLKLKSTRAKILDEYLGIVKSALEAGIRPRCHFEDITRADINGFCLPFAEKLLALMQEAKTPIKIRLCDTMGFGVTFPGPPCPAASRGWSMHSPRSWGIRESSSSGTGIMTSTRCM